MRTAVSPSLTHPTPFTDNMEIQCDAPPADSSAKRKASKKTSKIKTPSNAAYFDWRTLNWSMTLPKSRS